MAANVQPIFSIAPSIQWSSGGALTAANSNLDGTGTVATAFTAGSEGSYVTRMRFKPLGTNVATVARVFINNGGSTGTAANNVLFAELTLAATSASAVAALPDYELPLGFGLPAGYKITWCLGTAVAGGYVATVVGGIY